MAREIFTAAGGAAPEAPVSTRPARLSSIYLVIAEAVRSQPAPTAEVIANREAESEGFADYPVLPEQAFYSTDNG